MRVAASTLLLLTSCSTSSAGRADDPSRQSCGDTADCADGNPCTDDVCDPANGCRHTPNTASCDDADVCTSSDVCAAGACAGLPLDRDGDGYAPESCAGSDCLDSAAAVNPMAFEGPPGDATCSDGLDNDCDGSADQPDSGCQELPCDGTIPSGTGETRTRYASAGVAWDATCVEETQTRLCTDGVWGAWSGTYAHDTCAVAAPADCIGPDSAPIAHDGRLTYYQTASVPFGFACVSETRTCTDGILGGTYLHPTCVVLGFDVVSVADRQLTEPLRVGWSYASEITPLLGMQPNGERYYILSTSYSHKCLSADNILFQDVAIDPARCGVATISSLLEETIGPIGQTTYKLPAAVDDDDWRFSYDGIMGHALIGAPGAQRVLAVRHAEHVNTALGGHVYQGRVFPWVDAQVCASTYVGGEYQQCWEAFANFVTLGWAPYDPVNGWDSTARMNDEGPIIWPSSAYVGEQEGTPVRLSGGFYHPTMFVEDPYVYVMFMNTNDLSSRDAQHTAACISIARAPVSGAGAPGTWKNYHNGSFSEDSLPAGFSKELIADFYDVPGNPADCIHNDPASLDAWSLGFNIARVRGTPYYLGVEERLIDHSFGDWQLGIRLSTDLVNWTPLNVMQTEVSWNAGWYNYPTLIDRGATTNHLIDGADFYLLGKHATNGTGYELSVMQLSLMVDGFVMPPVALTREERLAIHYYEQLLAWQMPFDDPGVIWHAQYIIDLGCEADVLSFVQSVSFQYGPTISCVDAPDYVAMLYRAILSREPDAPGAAYWAGELCASSLNRDTLVQALFGSAEAEAVCRAGLVLP